MPKAPTLSIALIIAVLITDVASADPLAFTYHGWQIDLTNARGIEPDQKIISAVDHQLDIVEQVGLSPDTLQFMRGVRVWAEPGEDTLNPGYYTRATGVDIRVILLDPKKPIILHALLHAYHDQRLPGGVTNPDVLRFLQSGKTIWPSGSYMLSNERASISSAQSRGHPICARSYAGNSPTTVVVSPNYSLMVD